MKEELETYNKDLEIIATSTDAEEINDALSRHEGDRDFMYEAGNILDSREDIVSKDEAVNIIDNMNMDMVREDFPDIKISSEDVEVPFETLSNLEEIKTSDSSEYGVSEFYIKDDVENSYSGEASDLVGEYMINDQFDTTFADKAAFEIALDFQESVNNGAVQYGNGMELYETESNIFIDHSNKVEVIDVNNIEEFVKHSENYSETDKLVLIAEGTEKQEVLDVLSKVDNEEVKDAVRENPNTSEETIENMDKAAMLKNDFQALSVNDQIDIKTDGQFNDDQEKQTNSGSMKM